MCETSPTGIPSIAEMVSWRSAGVPSRRWRDRLLLPIVSLGLFCGMQPHVTRRPLRLRIHRAILCLENLVQRPS
jgi:hypothetical protein